MKKYWFVSDLQGSVPFEGTIDEYNAHLDRTAESCETYVFSRIYNSSAQRDSDMQSVNH